MSIPPPGTELEAPPAPAAAPAPDEPPWRPWMAPAAVALGFLIGLVASIVVDVFAQVGGSSLTHPTPAVSLAADLVFDLSFVAAASTLPRCGAGPGPVISASGDLRSRTRSWDSSSPGSAITW